MFSKGRERYACIVNMSSREDVMISKFYKVTWCGCKIPTKLKGNFYKMTLKLIMI